MTDLLFALDSIPAIYGLTKEPYIVLTANLFALMGLRQLFFLIDGLLERLVYLPYGLAVILGFVALCAYFQAAGATQLLGVALLVVFGGQLEWFPLRGLTSSNWDELSWGGKIADYLWHITLPVTAMVISWVKKREDYLPA